MLTVQSDAYDIQAWKRPVHRHLNIDAAIKTGISIDGIHQIGLTEAQTLDMLVQGLEKFESTDTPRVLLVCFSAAIPHGTQKYAPFFSGQGIASSLNLPIIAISDPTLALDNNISLSWYAGNEDLPDLPVQISRILNAVARQHNARLLVFGGSGGGYAALQQATLLEVETSIVVWNPQTIISNYLPKAVISYIGTAFPSLKSKTSSENPKDTKKRAQHLKEILDSTPIVHDVCGLETGKHVDILYLQNRYDKHHISNHATPYFSVHTYKRIGQAAFFSPDGQCAAFLGQWGDPDGHGHVVPPKLLLEFLMKELISGKKSSEVAQHLDNGIEGLCGKVSDFQWFSADPTAQISAEAWIDHGRIHASCKITSPSTNTTDGLQYAYYLFIDGERKETHSYKPEASTVFNCTAITGHLEVTAFAKDMLGNIIYVRVPVHNKEAP